MPEEQCHVLCKIFKNACFAPQRTDNTDRVPRPSDRNFCLISPAEQLSNLGQLIQLL